MLKTPLIIVLLLIVLVAVIPTIAEELPTINNPPTKQEAGKTTDSKQNTKTQNQNSTSPLTTINPTPSPPLQEIRENESPQYGKEQKSSWWYFSLTDALLAIFTCGLVIVGWFQVRILRRTLNVTDGLLGVAQEQSGDMKASIAIAQKAGDAADKSAKALPIMERAYVFSNIKLDKKIDVGDKEFYALLYLKNHGKTPAIIKEIGFMGYKTPSNDPLIELHIHHPVDSIIGSGDEFEEDRHWFEIKASDWETLVTTKPQIKFFCLGYVKYITVFGEEDCHTFYWEFYPPDVRFVLVQSEKLNHNT